MNRFKQVLVGIMQTTTTHNNRLTGMLPFSRVGKRGAAYASVLPEQCG